jgi:transposase-like protein
VFWSGYRRYVRAAGRCRKIFVPRLRCAPCGVSHALLPAFTLAWRLDVAETIGTVLAEVAGGGCGVRPAAERAGVPYETARGWVRRFRARGRELGVAFAALAVELGGAAVTPPAGAGRFALAAVGAAFAAAAGLPGWRRVGAWRFASAVTGGRLIAANTASPWFVVGRRRFMPPIPP